MELQRIRYSSPAVDDAFGALSAAAHKRELRESFKYSCSQNKTKQKILINLTIYIMNSALSKHLHSLTLSLHVKNSVSSSSIFCVSRNWLFSGILNQIL